MKRLALLTVALLTSCGPTLIHDRGPLETLRLLWVVFWHDYGQRLLFWVIK